MGQVAHDAACLSEGVLDALVKRRGRRLVAVPCLRVYVIGSVQSSSVWQAHGAQCVKSFESTVQAALMFAPLSLTF